MKGRVGVLALQGDVREHLELLRGLDAAALPVRSIEDLDTVDALVLPGGESTTIGFLLDEHGVIEPLRKRIEEGLPVLGTCAGAILLARSIVVAGDTDSGRVRREWPKIGVLDAVVYRNAYGRQLDSFEADVDVEGAGKVHAVFIRAPVISEVGAEVEVLATHRETPVVVRQGNILAATFHPELARENGLHRLLLQSCDG